MTKGEPFDLERFHELLEINHRWPCEYLFKFIVPAIEYPRLSQLFPGEKLEQRPSKKGNYLAVTINSRKESSQEVIAVYKAAMEISGIIAL